MIIYLKDLKITNTFSDYLYMNKRTRLKIKSKLYLNNFWKIIKKTFVRFVDNQGLLIANGLAFKTIIALVPVLMIIAGALQIFPAFATLKENFFNLLKGYIVPSSFQIVVSWIDNILDKTGAISIVSIIVFVYLSLDLLITLDNQVERIWASKLKKSIIQKVLKYWALLSATPFVLGGYFHYSGLIRSILLLTPLSNLTYFEELIYTFISLLLLTAFLFFIFFIVPNTKVHFKKALLLSIITAVIWIFLRSIFTYYTRQMIGRWSILYGSFAALLFFIIWTSINWIVMLFGIEFLCVWQNKLYLGNIKFRELFIFDVGFLLLLLDEFYSDFKQNGEGISVYELSEKYKYNHDDVNDLITLFETEGLLIGDNNPEQKYHLKRDISKIKLSEVESLVWKRLTALNYHSTPKLQQICSNLGNYYLKHKKEQSIFLDEII